MTKGERKKGFDCVAFKRDAQERIYAQLKNLSRSEEIEYFEGSIKHV